MSKHSAAEFLDYLYCCCLLFVVVVVVVVVVVSLRYLRERFGEDEVGVEHKKKENRSETGFITTMADYLEVSVILTEER